MMTGGNELTGKIPSEFALMNALEAAALGDNKLTGSIPTELGSISGLKQIELNNNKLSGPIPSEFGLLAVLEEIDIGKLVSYKHIYVGYKICSYIYVCIYLC